VEKNKFLGLFTKGKLTIQLSPVTCPIGGPSLSETLLNF
jgi:hypothetical protein